MKIHEYYYDDDTRNLRIQFSTKEDKDDFYRELDLNYEDVEYYSPDIITEDDMEDIDKNFIKEILNEYLLENDLPESQPL